VSGAAVGIGERDRDRLMRVALKPQH